MAGAADLIKSFEGCRLSAYRDQGGVWTVGWGLTGAGIGPGVVWTQKQADEALDHRLAALQDVVLHLVKVAITPAQLAAMVSLAWNIGSSAFGNSTVLRRLNDNDFPGAADAFAMWVKVAGEVNKGLQTRRSTERAVFLGDLTIDDVANGSRLLV